MKVILNQDVNPLGEEGDVKDVANGYARNYLFPRNLAVPYNERSILMFEARKAEIEARKAEKRKDAASFKEKLEALELTLVMPAGANGKLYGAVTSQTLADEFVKQGLEVERKRIEVPGNSFKAVGKYKIHVRLYENQGAEVSVVVKAQPHETSSSHASSRQDNHGRHRGPAPVEAAPATEASPEAIETQDVEAPAQE